MAKGHNLKRERFILEYLKDGNGTQAAIRAGYSRRSAHTQAYELLRVPEVQAAIRKARSRGIKDFENTRQRVIKELLRLALVNATSCVRVIEGHLIIDDTALVPDDVTAAISSLKQTEFGVSVKFHSKHGALHDLAMHFGILDGEGDKEARGRPTIVVPGLDIPAAKPTP